MAAASDGDTVRVHYTGELDDGVIFDTSAGGEPLQFTLGAGAVIPGFEQAVLGMDPGETTTVRIPANDGYGERRDDLVLEVERDQVPPDLNPQVGERLEIRRQDGSSVPVTVSAVSEKIVTLDANHPLAGQALTFQIELVEIVG